MQQVSDKSELRRLEQRITSLLDAQETRLDQRLQILEAPTVTPVQYAVSPNYLVNSHPEWSRSAYTTAGVSASTVSDANRECYNWYSGKASGFSPSQLLATGHSGFAGLAAEDPVWDYVAGNFLMGSSTNLIDIACPLTTDFVYPGQTFYVYAELALADSTVVQPANMQIYAGFYDRTGGIDDWIQGSAFTVTATAQGVTGSRSLEYKVLAETDSGEQILSAAVTVANAPATLSTSNRVKLTFTGAPGFIYYGIYRKDGSTYRLVGEVRNSIDLTFYDMQETSGSIESGYPSVSTTNPRAYAQSTDMASLSYGTFTPHTLKIKVPLTYNRSATGNGQQWFRFGFTTLIGAGDERGIAVRRVCVSEGYGGWSRSPLDLSAKSSPTTTTSSAPGSGTPTIDPPPSGGGGGARCVLPETLVDVLRTEVIGGLRKETVVKLPIGELKKGQFVVCGAESHVVQKVRRGTVQAVYEIETRNGQIVTCSESHRLITSRSDKQGKAVQFIREGDLVLTSVGGQIEQSEVIRKTEIIGAREVVSIQLPKPHLFVTNGFISHNYKSEEFGA